MTDQLMIPDTHVGDTIGPVEEAFSVDINGALITAYLRSDLTVDRESAEAKNVAEMATPDDDGNVLVAWWQLDTTGLASGWYWLHVTMLRNGITNHIHRQRIYLLPD